MEKWEEKENKKFNWPWKKKSQVVWVIIVTSFHKLKTSSRKKSFGSGNENAWRSQLVKSVELKSWMWRAAKKVGKMETIDINNGWSIREDIQKWMMIWWSIIHRQRMRTSITIFFELKYKKSIFKYKIKRESEN